MVSSLNRSNPARENWYEMVSYIATRIQPDSTGTNPKTKMIGTIPSGAIITWVHSKVVTAITGGTPVLSVGSLGDSGLDNLVATMAETAGSELLQPLATITQPLASDTEFWVSISGAATAGDTYVCIAFYKPIA